MHNWTAIGTLADIPRAGARVVNTPLGRLALFRTSDDQVYAMKDQCPHRGGPLSQGMVFGHRVSCPMHGVQIDLETGHAVSPDEGCVAKFPVRVEGDTVLLGLAGAEDRSDAA